jgi:hypothetical protein
MFRSRALLASLVATLWLVAPLDAGAQPVTRLATSGTTGTIAANGESVVMSTGGLAAFAVQTLDSYSGTWEVQCSTDGGTTYDADDEVNLTLVGATSTVASVTDTVGIWQGNAAGCTHIKVIATAGFAASNVGISMQAISSGGGSGGGGAGGTFDGVLLDAAGGDSITDTANDALRVNIIAGAGSGGTAAADESAFTLATTNLTPMGCIEATDTAAAGSVMAVRCGNNRVLDVDVISMPSTTVTATNLDVQIGGSDSLTVGTFPDNEPFNIAQMNGVAVTMGNGASGTGVQRVTIANDSTGVLATVSNVATIGTSVTPGTAAANLGKAEDAAHASGDVGVLALAVRQNTQSDLAADGDNIPLTVADTGGLRVDVASIAGAAPAAAICDDPSKVTTFNINLGAGTGNTELVALNGSDLIYVCSFVYTTGGADTPQLIYGTGTACATGETDLMTLNLAAAGDGLVENGGGAVITKAPAGNALCLERTNSVTAMGRLGYVRQP